MRFVEELRGGEADPAAVRWFEDVTERFGVRARATLLLGGEAIAGPPVDDLAALAPEAALVNISGHLGGLGPAATASRGGSSSTSIPASLSSGTSRG